MESHTHELLMFRIENTSLQVFCENKIIVKFIQKHKGYRISKTILKKEQRNHTTWLQDLLLYSYSNNDSVELAKGQTNNQWNRIENLEIVLHIHSQMITTKVPKQFNDRKVLFNKWWQNTEYLHKKKINLTSTNQTTYPAKIPHESYTH